MLPLDPPHYQKFQYTNHTDKNGSFYSKPITAPEPLFLPSLNDIQDPSTSLITPMDLPSTPKERLLIISSAISDPDLLARAAKEGVTLLRYDYNSSLDQLRAKIIQASKNKEFDSIAFATHATPGTLPLVAHADLTQTSLNKKIYQNFWQSITRNLPSHCRIDLLGCDLASDSNGLGLIQGLENLTKRHFAASTTPIGFTEGNWLLETDEISADEIYFDKGKLDLWKGTLSTPPYTSGTLFDGLQTCLNIAPITSTAIGGVNSTVTINATLYKALYDYNLQPIYPGPSGTGIPTPEWGVLFEASYGADIANVTIEYNPATYQLRIRNGSSAAPTAYKIYNVVPNNLLSQQIQVSFGPPFAVLVNGAAPLFISATGTPSFPSGYYPQLQIGKSYSAAAPNNFFGEIRSVQIGNAATTIAQYNYDANSSSWLGSSTVTLSSNIPLVSFGKSKFTMSNYDPNIRRALYLLDRLNTLLQSTLTFKSAVNNNAISYSDINSPAFQAIYSTITDINRIINPSVVDATLNPLLTTSASFYLRQYIQDTAALTIIGELQNYMQQSSFPYFGKYHGLSSTYNDITDTRTGAALSFNPPDRTASYQFISDAAQFFTPPTGVPYSVDVTKCTTLIAQCVAALQASSTTLGISSHTQQITPLSDSTFLDASNGIANKLISKIDVQLTLASETMLATRRALIALENLMTCRSLTTIPRNHRGEFAIPVAPSMFSGPSLPALGDEWSHIYEPGNTVFYSGSGMPSISATIIGAFRLHLPLFVTATMMSTTAGISEFLFTALGVTDYSPWAIPINTTFPMLQTICEELNNVMLNPLLPSSQKTVISNNILAPSNSIGIIATGLSSTTPSYPLNVGLTSVIKAANTFTSASNFFINYGIPTLNGAGIAYGKFSVLSTLATGAPDVGYSLGVDMDASISTAAIMPYNSGLGANCTLSSSTNYYPAATVSTISQDTLIATYKKYYLLYKWLEDTQVDLKIADAVSSFQGLNENYQQTLEQNLSDYHDLMNIIATLIQRWMQIFQGVFKHF